MAVMTNILAFLAVFSAVSRGLLELYFPTIIAYAIQMFLGFIFVIFIFIRSASKPKKNFKVKIMFFISFMIFSSISATLTSFAQGFYISWLYVVVMNYYMFLFFITTSFDFKTVERVNFNRIISIIAFILIVIATLQQYQIETQLPGITIFPDIRPSSLTGSYLHYPLVISLFFFYFLQSWVLKKKYRDLFFVLLTSLAIITSFSRSGMMLILVGIVFNLVFRYEIIDKKILRLVLFILIGFVFIVMNLDSLYVERLFSTLQLTGLGNSQRFSLWTNGIEMWLKTNLVIGSYTGQVTNLTSNISDIGNSTVVESGLIQQLLNFGAIGTFLFYSFFVLLYNSIDKDYFWIKSGIVAAVVQSFAYQSIEVYPFMFMLSIFPVIVRSETVKSDYIHKALVLN